MPRGTLTAPLSLPPVCNSAGSRTSTTSTLPRPIRARASAGGTRGTSALAAASICFKLVGIIASVMLRIRSYGEYAPAFVSGTEGSEIPFDEHRQPAAAERDAEG